MHGDVIYQSLKVMVNYRITIDMRGMDGGGGLSIGILLASVGIQS